MLRNSLLPTITVVATQVGYLVGGLAIVETLFNYPGIGYLILQAAKNKDFPLLESAVLTIGLVYSRGDDHRRPPVRAAQPAHPGLALVSSEPGIPLAAEVPLPGARARCACAPTAATPCGASSSRRRSSRV